MKKILLFLLTIFITPLAFSAPKPQYNDINEMLLDNANASDFELFDNTKSVIQFNSTRVLHFTDGHMFICPYNADLTVIANQKVCTTPNGVGGFSDAWVPLLELNVDGFEISGVRFLFNDRGDTSLMIYFKRK